MIQSQTLLWIEHFMLPGFLDNEMKFLNFGADIKQLAYRNWKILKQLPYDGKWNFCERYVCELDGSRPQLRIKMSWRVS